MIFIIYSVALLLLAAIPMLLILKNLPQFHLAPQVDSAETLPDASPISVLIPARDEAQTIQETLERVLASEGVELEVIVLDDHSTDETPELVRKLSDQDERVRLESSEALPDGWNGKQFACWQLANHAKFERLCFLDADVRVEPNCLRRMLAELERSGCELISGFPRQIMNSFAEQHLLPLMYHVLLGYLPLDRMRASSDAAFGAGCGQLFLAQREAYFESGGHESIKSSRHDGLKLPRSFRASGFRSDLFDASDIASVRMYAGTLQVVNGLMKNATEGIANSKLIVIFTILLLGGSVLPILSFLHAIFYGWTLMGMSRFLATQFLGVATIFSFVQRWLIAKRFGQSLWSVAFHPLSVLVFVGVQWIAFARDFLGLPPVAWRGRV